MNFRFSLILVSSIAGLLFSCGVEDPSAMDEKTSEAALQGDRVVYLGRQEVLNGALKSADGQLPVRGQRITLKAFLPELASFVCREYCFPSSARVFVRFDGVSNFQELTQLPVPSYRSRGPSLAWSIAPFDGIGQASLLVPGNADRVEAFVLFDRLTYRASACTFAHDQMECPETSALPSAYLSNFGRNFRIGVR